MANRARKSEHSGAKSGGGHWGTRQEAKRFSKKVRRTNDKKAVIASGSNIETCEGGEGDSHSCSILKKS